MIPVAAVPDLMRNEEVRVARAGAQLPKEDT
jgi:hypothetical protein